MSQVSSSWSGLPFALVVVFCTLGGTIAWSTFERRRARLDAHVERTGRAFTDLWTRLLTQPPRRWQKAWGSPPSVTNDFVAAMGALAELRTHLKRPRWRSTSWGFAETLETLERELRATVVEYTNSSGDSDSTEALIMSVQVMASAVSRWAGRRRSFWKGDISQELGRSFRNPSPIEGIRPRTIPRRSWLRPN